MATVHQTPLPPMVYDVVTKPRIDEAVRLTHAAVRAEIPLQTFIWAGFDFIVDEAGRPWMLEVNVKPSWRYHTPDQFPAPLVCDMALAGLNDLARVIENDMVKGSAGLGPGTDATTANTATCSTRRYVEMEMGGGAGMMDEVRDSRGLDEPPPVSPCAMGWRLLTT